MSSVPADYTPAEKLPEIRESAGAKLSGLFHYMVQLASLTLFFGLGAIICPVCWLLAKLSGGRISPHVGQEVIHQLFRFYVWWFIKVRVLRIRFEGTESLRNIKGMIVVGNHPGLMDAVILLSLMPRAVCAMRASLRRNPMLGGAALLADYVSNDTAVTLLRQAIRKIRDGDNLLIFPEGTRTVSKAVNSFKPGFAFVAVKTGAAVQTVLISREGRFLSKGVGLFAPARFPLLITIRLSSVFHPQPGETAQEFSGRIETHFHDHIENTGENIRFKSVG